MTFHRMPRLLVIDDDPTWLEQVPIIFEDECVVDGYATIDQGLAAVEAHYYDIVLLDINFDGDSRTGLEIYKKINALDCGTDVIVISGETDHHRLIEIFNTGVSKYIAKPSSPKEIRAAVNQTLDGRERKRQALQFLTKDCEAKLIGSSVAMQKLRSEIQRVVASGARDILLQGETGTGKELVAKSIAYQADPSLRMTVLHCGAITDTLAESEFFGHVKGAYTGATGDRAGAFEAAGGGYVFLDEIAELPKSQQAKILRVLQERKVRRVGTNLEKPVKFRCIAATHVNLANAVKKDQFREDLYFRIARETLTIAPLRERPEDIPELVHFFMNKNIKTKQMELTSEAMTLLQSYTWPGNVRELESSIDCLASKCRTSTVREKDIYKVIPTLASWSRPRGRPAAGTYTSTLVLSEKERFEKAIIKADGNRTEAAGILGISRATFFRRAKELGLVNERKKTQPKQLPVH